MNIYVEVDKICEKGYNEQRQYHQEYSIEPPYTAIRELLENFFEQVKVSGQIKDYTIDNFSYDDPGYACGAVFMAWITAEGKLEATTYEWEAV